MATLESVQAKIAKLHAQADALRKKRSAGAIAQIHALMSEYGLSLEDLASASEGRKVPGKAATKKSSGRSASVAKYQDPKSGATWSGHGRAPGWLANARNRDRFLIDSSAVSVPVEDKQTAKPGNYIRGKQPAMYRDPKTGKEWSGRGKAPGWLASARDRTKFLIDGASATPSKAKERAPKAVAAKKVRGEKSSATVSAKRSTTRKTAGTAAKTPVGKTVAANKSTEAKKGPHAGNKKTGAEKVATRNAGDKATVPSSTVASEVAAATPAA